MKLKKLIACGIAAACLGGIASAAPTTRPTTPPAKAPATARIPISRAVVLRSQYNPFVLERQAVLEARAASVQRVAGEQVRPPYRPPVRSPYQPPVRGPLL
jgi:hypothetical protein